MSVLRAFALAVTLTAGFVPLAQSQEQEPERDFGAEDDPVLIPEPMVFGLVRGLGADKGELEVNVLGSSRSKAPTLERRSGHPRSRRALRGFALEHAR